MIYKKLGRTDLTPSVLGFGCSRIASVSTIYTRKEIHATLREAIDRGITFFDTADIYGQGDSERLVGKALRDIRKRVIICSKAGLMLSAPPVVIRLVKPFARAVVRRWQPAYRTATGVRKDNERQCFEPEYIRKRIEGSLRRLRTDYLDIFLLHNPPPEIISRSALFDRLETLKRKGMIRYYGVSCRSPDDARLCLQQTDISCLQLTCNLLNLGAINDLLTRAQTAGIGVISREPFGGGAIFSHPPLLHVCATDDRRRSPAQMALQFLLRCEDIGVILTGMAGRSHLLENLGALDAIPLSTDEIDRLCRPQ